MPIFAASLSGRESWRRIWGGSAWWQGWCGRRGSHSGVCSGDRHSDFWLCGLGKVWCMWEPWVSWDDWGVPGGLSKRAGVAGTACSSRGSVLATGASSGTSEPKWLPWQPLCSGDCVDSYYVWPQLFMQVAKVELGWRPQSYPHALVLQGNWKPASIALQPARKPAHRLHGKDGTMRLNLRWIWDEYFRCCRWRMDD